MFLAENNTNIERDGKYLDTKNDFSSSQNYTIKQSNNCGGFIDVLLFECDETSNKKLFRHEYLVGLEHDTT